MGILYSDLDNMPSGTLEESVQIPTCESAGFKTMGNDKVGVYIEANRIFIYKMRIFYILKATVKICFVGNYLTALLLIEDLN